jgi:hypothetical protein
MAAEFKKQHARYRTHRLHAKMNSFLF